MTKDLAKTLTTALVQWIDRERPEGTMCCSSAECESIEQMFEGGCYDVVEEFIKKKLEAPLTPFQQCLNGILRKVYFAEAPTPTAFIIKCIQNSTKELLELAKKQLLSYPDESNPAIVDMADLQRTLECNHDKLPLCLKNEIERIKRDAYTRGYNKGHKDAEDEYNKSVAFHYDARPICWEPGGACTNPQMDCVNCPKKTTGGGFKTSSGTSTLKAEGYDTK